MHAVDVVFLVIPRIPSDKNVKEAISGPRTVSDVKKKGFKMLKYTIIEICIILQDSLNLKRLLNVNELSERFQAYCDQLL